MKYKFISVLTIITMICVTFMSAAYCDDSSYYEYPQSGTVFPINNDFISMVSEDVIFSNNQFITIFVFKNMTDIEQEVSMGFPVVDDYAILDIFDMDEGVNEEAEYLSTLNDVEKKKYLANKIESYYRFKSFINGIEVERQLVELNDLLENIGYKYVFLTKVKFKANETITVTNIYNQAPNSFADNIGNSNKHIKYILKTGAAWKSDIDKANLHFYLDVNQFSKKNYEYLENIDLDESSYKGEFLKFYIHSNYKTTTISNKGDYYLCQWNLSNIEPDKDLEVDWGYRTYNLNTKELISLIQSVKGKQIANDLLQYKVFFEEMQDARVYYDYIIALSKCKLSSGFSEGNNLDKAFLINSLYALKGYKFNNTEWTDYFNLFKWYNANNTSPWFSYEEKDIIEKLLKVN